MTFSEISQFVPLIAAGAYLVLFVIAYSRREQHEVQTRWLLVFLGVSIAWQMAIYLAPRLGVAAIDVAGKLLLVGTVALGITTSLYLDRPHVRRWLIAGAVGISAAILAELFLPPVEISFGAFSSSYAELTSSLIWLGFSAAIFLSTYREYRRTRFPWHANRVLYWAIALFVTFLGEALLHLNWSGLTLLGQVIRFIGACALTYAVSSHRLFDVSTRSRRALSFILVTGISAVPIIVGFFIIYNLDNFISNTVLLWTLYGIIVLLSLFLYDQFRGSVERGLSRLLFGDTVNPNTVVRHYTRAIANTLDMQQLSLAIINALSELLRINRGALLLVTNREEDVHVEVVPALGRVPLDALDLLNDDLLITELRNQHQPLLQYEIDFNPHFAILPAERRQWFSEMGMDVYVPIISNDRLEGIIAVGPKRTGATFQRGELDLLQVLADQTGVALRNARLYGELGEQNDKIRELNGDLIGQNARLEIMDQVKTDFITIASHELRTPLTQVKGYADILTVMNDESNLSQEQAREIMGYINRATGQLEQVITALLDASQLDVEGMKLTYIETTLDTVIRMATEPLRPALRERRITLETLGLAELPPIFADFQRMVQAFNNIIGNAVKYTPDHGTISVSAEVQTSAESPVDYLEITIADTGIGIDPRFHDLIFEKFFRVGSTELHSTGSTKFKGAGPGLGLPIAKGVIEGHHGRIWVESSGEDEARLPGSQFHIVLPIDPREIVKQDSAPQQTPEASAESLVALQAD